MPAMSSLRATRKSHNDDQKQTGTGKTMYANLRIQLWKAGIRQNRLAKMIKMDETVLSRIVNGFREPSPEFRKKISIILQSDEKWLFQMAASPADIAMGPTDGKSATSGS